METSKPKNTPMKPSLHLTFYDDADTFDVNKYFAAIDCLINLATTSCANIHDV